MCAEFKYDHAEKLNLLYKGDENRKPDSFLSFLKYSIFFHSVKGISIIIVVISRKIIHNRLYNIRNEGITIM